MKKFVIGIGSNLDQPLQQVRQAVQLLRQNNRLQITTVSSAYQTKPVGFNDQPDFINAVVLGTTTASPHACLAACQRVEQQLGRVRTGNQNGPRVIDCDLIWMQQVTLSEPTLTLPHPRATARGFVMYPLAEVAPQHPLLSCERWQACQQCAPKPPIVGQIA